MSTFPIKILDFKSAHMFFITMDVEGKKQQKISELIIKDHKKIEDTCSNEIVAVRYNDQYARANILETIVNDQSMVKNYNCWLIDFGQRIICNIIYQLPKYIQNIEPNCKIASLSNFCYLNSILELGIKGSITSNQTCCASSGVIKCTFDLISTSDKIVFDLKQEIANVLLIGDLLIHKDDTILSLSEQLERRGLITRSESVFQELIKDNLKFINSHFPIISHSSPNSPAERTTCDPNTLPPLDLDRRIPVQQSNKKLVVREIIEKMRKNLLKKQTHTEDDNR